MNDCLKIGLRNKKRVFCLFVFLSVMVGGIMYTNNILAEEAEDYGSIMCEKGSSIVQENQLEIDIGRTMDYTEYLADQIIEEATLMIQAAEQEMQASEKLVAAVNECKADNCQPECVKKCDSYTCRTCAAGEIVPASCNVTCSSNEICCRNPYYGDYCKGCEPGEKFSPAVCSSECKNCGSDEICCATTRCDGEPCSGEPCPIEVQTARDEFLNAAATVDAKQASIRALWEEMNKEIPPKLEKARKRFAACVIRPFEQGDFLRGELTGKLLLSCRKVMDSKIPIHTKFAYWDVGGLELGPLEEGCYGSRYCQRITKEGKDLPYPPAPCGEDFFCCIMGE